MGCTSCIRPRPRLWPFGGIRFILSATAFVRSGLHIRTEAFAPALLASCPGETLHPSSFCPATRPSTSQGPQGSSSVTRASSARSGSAWDGRGHQRDRANRQTALDAIGTAFAATNDVSLREKKLSRRAAGNNVNRATKIALGRTTAQPMTVLEEAALVGEVKTLAGYLKTRDNLTAELGRTPSHEEWATSVGLTFDELSAQMEASHHAQERIVEANTGLIVMMARRYHPIAFHQGTIANDLIQEGSLALLRAAETFNPHLGYRFSTYAGWWVRDRVQRCVVDQARLIRLPRHVHNFRRAIAKTEVLLLKEFARPPTPEETAERMKVDVARVIRYSNCPETFSLDDVAFASSTNGRIGGGRSIGRGPGKNAGVGYRHEKVACSMISPEQRAEVFLFQAKLDQLMSVLSPDERLVVSLRYGLGGVSPVTLNEMAEKAGSTKHRVRMVETRALNKLRCRPEPRQYGRTGSVLIANGERDTVQEAKDSV